MVPENFKISMLPAFFNHTDAERIGTVIRDSSSKFLIETGKKVKFSVGVKIFPYNSNVNSVRIVLVKFEPIADAGNNPDDIDDNRSHGSKGKSKSSKSKKSKSREDPQDAAPPQK